MNFVDILGYLAAILTTCSFVPQVMQTIKTRETKDISLAMYSLFTAGLLVWLVYGIFTSQWSIVAANAVTLSLASVVLTMKIRNYSSEKK